MATTSTLPPPVQSQSGAPISFKGARSSPNAADRSKRRDSDHSFSSRGPVVELDSDEDSAQGPRGALGKETSSQDEVAPTSSSPLSIQASHTLRQSPDLFSTVRASPGGERQGTMPIPAPGALNQSDLRAPLLAFRIRGHPEFDETVRMPEPTSHTLSQHHLPGGLIYTDSASSRDSRVTDATDDDERLWEENQALYRQIQSRLGIEDSATPSEQSSSAHTPVLPIPGGFPPAFQFGGAESSDNEEGHVETSAQPPVRLPHSFPQPVPHAGSSSGTSLSLLPPTMPQPTRAPLIERPSTDSFFTTNSDSVYLTPHQHEGGGGGGTAAESEASDDEDYTRKLSNISIPEPPSTPPSFPAPSSIAEPTTPKAASGIPQPHTRPSIPAPFQQPHGYPSSASMPKPVPKLSIPEPVQLPEVVPPEPKPSLPLTVPVPVPAAPTTPKPESKPTIFSTTPRPQHTIPSPSPSLPQPPASTYAKPTVPPLVPSISASTPHQQQQQPASNHPFAPTKPPGSSLVPTAPSSASLGVEQKPPPPRPQQQQHLALGSHSSPLATHSTSQNTLQAKPPSRPDQPNTGSFAGGKPSNSSLSAPSKPSNPSPSPSPLHGLQDSKPSKPQPQVLGVGGATGSYSGNAAHGNALHTSSSTSLSTAKPPPKPSFQSISEAKPTKVSPSHSTLGGQSKPEGGYGHGNGNGIVASSSSASGKPSNIHSHNANTHNPNNTKPTSANPNSNPHNTRYVNMLLALDDIPNYWNVLASFFTWILLAGFLLFPGTFTSWREEQAQAAGAGGVSEQVKGAVLDVVSHVPLYVIAWVCSAIGVVGMGWLWWRWMANYIWLLNKVFVPGLLNALAGLVSTLANIFGAQSGQLSTTALTTLIVTASSTGVLLIMVLFYQFWLLRRVQNEHARAVGRQKAGRHGEGVLKGMMESKSQAMRQGA